MFLDIPLAVSFPHFYNGDPTLLNPFEGLSPDEAKHGTEIIIQPVSQCCITIQTECSFKCILTAIRNSDESAFSFSNELTNG